MSRTQIALLSDASVAEISSLTGIKSEYLKGTEHVVITGKFDQPYGDQDNHNLTATLFHANRNMLKYEGTVVTAKSVMDLYDIVRRYYHGRDMTMLVLSVEVEGIHQVRLLVRKDGILSEVTTGLEIKPIIRGSEIKIKRLNLTHADSSNQEKILLRYYAWLGFKTATHFFINDLNKLFKPKTESDEYTAFMERLSGFDLTDDMEKMVSSIGGRSNDTEKAIIFDSVRVQAKLKPCGRVIMRLQDGYYENDVYRLGKGVVRSA